MSSSRSRGGRARSGGAAEHIGGARRNGSLTVVGTGIQLALQATPQTRAVIERADEVLYLVNDPLTASWIARLNRRARSLAGLYAEGKDRAQTYGEMVDEILAEVRAGKKVAVAFYGHPGVFVDPGHEAVRRARAEGFRARMLAAVSAEDCLFADLGIDPGDAGCQSYEATAFLIHGYRIEPAALLVLWQVGFLGERHMPAGRPRPPLDILVERLREFYPADHATVLYEASSYAVCGPAVTRQPLDRLARAEVAPMATLVIPPLATRSYDSTMLARLGLTEP